MNTNRVSIESVQQCTVSVIGRIEKNGQRSTAPSSRVRLGKFSLKITSAVSTLAFKERRQIRCRKINK